MQRNPHQLIEGIAIAALAADAGHAFIFIRGEYDLQADILDAAVAEAYEAGYLGEDILGTPPRPRAGRPPRRRRLHLRRGDGAARRARGQARQPAAEAAVPGGAGPLRRADADQQRRDALQRAADRRQRRRVVQGLRHRAVAGDQGRLGLRRRAAARQLRGRAGDPDPGADLRPRRRARGGPRGEGLLPRRLLLPGPHRRGGARPPLQLRGDGRGRLDARLRLDHRRRRPRLDPPHGAAHGALLPPRVLRQVHPLPRGHQLDGEDAGAGGARRGDADGPRHRRLGPGEHHRPLPLRARRLDGDAGRGDGPQVPRGVRAGDGRRRPRPSTRTPSSSGAPETLGAST